MEEKEIWKDVVGYEGLYEVSDFGNVRSVQRFVECYHNRSKCMKLQKVGGKVLKGTVDKYGYRSVALSKDGCVDRFFVHRLVAEAFISNPSNLPFVDHVSTIKTDNRVANLRWVTKETNNKNVITVQHSSKKSFNTRMRGTFRSERKTANFKGVDLRYIDNSVSLTNRRSDGAYLTISGRGGEKVCDFWVSIDNIYKLRDEINEYIESTKRIML